ncbi:DNA primase [Streptomyces sp. NPDC023327]|uniref:DNA primase n=1 Tax=Streptomyces sp. NPDC023327 TaxID=3157088 RepID=UPI0033EC2240
MNRLAMGLAVGAGYVLGRTKKAKFAFAVGTMVAGKRLNLSPKALGSLVTQQLDNNPQFKEIGDQLRQDLRGVGKAATGSLLNRQLEGLADRLHDRTLGVQDRIAGVVPDDVKGTDRDEDDEDSDAEDGAERDEGDRDEDEAPRRRRTTAAKRPAARKSGSRAGSKTDEESAPKSAAKKTAATAKKAPAKRTARKTAQNKSAQNKSAQSKSTQSKTAQKKTTSAARRTASGGRAKGGDRG